MTSQCEIGGLTGTFQSIIYPAERKKTFLEQAAFQHKVKVVQAYHRLSLLRKLEVGSRKLEVGSWKSEVGSRKSEVGSRKTLLGFRSICFSRNKRKRKSGPAYEKPSFNGSLNHEPSKNFFGAIFKMVLVNREFKLHVYGKRQTSDSS